MEQRTLSPEELDDFRKTGYIVVKGILSSVDCAKFDRQIVQSALWNCAGVHENDPSTWNSKLLRSMATSDTVKTKYLSGAMIRKADGSDPIADEDNIQLDPLNSILHQLHGGMNGHPSWEWIHSNLGWIHVRFPLYTDPSPFKDYIDLLSWHIDGGHFSPHYIDSPEQSVIILPMIRDVSIGGGNTLVLKKSHIYMAHQLKKAGSKGIPKEITQNLNNVATFWPIDLIEEIAPCNAGDVILIHPFLIHSAGLAKSGNPIRIAFNMGVKWKQDMRNDERSKSWMEDSISWCLQQRLNFLHD